MSGGCCSIAHRLFRQTNDDASQRFSGWATPTTFKVIVAFAVWIIHRTPAEYLKPNATADTAGCFYFFFPCTCGTFEFCTHADEAEPGQY